VPAERISVDYEGTQLPAYFFRAPDACPGERPPLVIVNNGSDGATSQMWVHGGAAAGERGSHWMTFDGPGQQATLYEQAIPFGPDRCQPSRLLDTPRAGLRAPRPAPCV
jgi:hypothetical protein